MISQAVETVVIGAGLSGLYAGWLLSRKQRPFVLLEARQRTGGRILCLDHEGFRADMGPSWYWPSIHPKVSRLIQTLGLKGYRQYEEGLGGYQSSNGAVRILRGYVMEPLSWRLCGSMQSIVEQLHARIPSDAVHLGHPVCRIEKNSGGLRIEIGELEKEPWKRFHAQRVILALPPRLAAASILFSPDLPEPLTQAMLRIGTWMAGQAKFCALYEEPFWRRSGLSGQAFSECGPLSEIHDGGNDGNAPFGFTGFVGVPAVQRRQPQLLREAILQQLAVFFGAEAAQPSAFFYQDWAREPSTATELDQPPMYEHPLYHPPAGRRTLWDGALIFAGTETADLHGGYMEGALNAAEAAVHAL